MPCVIVKLLAEEEAATKYQLMYQVLQREEMLLLNQCTTRCLTG